MHKLKYRLRRIEQGLSGGSVHPRPKAAGETSRFENSILSKVGSGEVVCRKLAFIGGFSCLATS